MIGGRLNGEYHWPAGFARRLRKSARINACTGSAAALRSANGFSASTMKAAVGLRRRRQEVEKPMTAVNVGDRRHLP